MAKRTSLAIVFTIIVTAFIGIETAQAEPPNAIKQFIPIAPFWYVDPDDGILRFCVVAQTGAGNCLTMNDINGAPRLENPPAGPSI